MARRAVLLIVLLIVSSVFSVTSAQDASISQIQAYGEAVHIRVSPDGRWVATFEESVIHGEEVFAQYLPVRVYSLESGEDALTLNGPMTYVADIAFSPDGTMLAAYAPTGYLYLWSLDGGELLKTILVVPGSREIEFVLDGSAIAITQSATPMVQVWDIESEAMTRVLMNRFTTMLEMRETFMSGRPDEYIYTSALSDGSTVYVATSHGNIEAWNVETGEGERILVSAENHPNFPIQVLQSTSDGSSLIYLDLSNDTLSILDTSNQSLRHFPAPDALGTALTLSPDSKSVAWLSVTDESTELVVTALDSGAEQRIPLPMDIPSWNSPLTSIAFLSDNQSVIVGRAQRGNPENALYIVRW